MSETTGTAPCLRRAGERAADLMARALRVTPGESQARAKAVFSGRGPGFICRGDGALVFDPDGRSYIDWTSSLGACTLGHGHPDVVDAVTRQVRDGILFSRSHALEATVAERLLALVKTLPRHSMVRWVKTGSEACSAAVRIARMATRRDVVLMAAGGYHGWHDWAATMYPDRGGVPAALSECTRAFAYNDVDDFERAVHACGADRVAAVLVEPMRLEWPRPGFLEHVRTRTQELGAVLVFDETLLGLRLSHGGGSEHFGLAPDLTVFGKALAGGLPLACVVGSPDLMRHATVVSSTFGGDVVALAAAEAVFGVYERENVIERIWTAGMALRDTLAPFAGVGTFHALGSPVHLVLRADEGRDTSLDDLRDALAADGILFDPGHVYPSAALSHEQVATTVACLTRATIHAYLGDRERAFQWLERSCRERSYWMTTLKVHPVVDSLRADPRFAEMMKRMGFE